MKPSYLLILFTALFGAFLFTVRPAAPDPVRKPWQPTVVQNPSPDKRAPERVVLTGTVQDRFGWPVSGAGITARPSVGGQPVSRASSDTEGRFALELADSSPVDLEVSAEGQGTEWVRRFPAQRQAGCITLGSARPWIADSQLPKWEGGRLAGEGFVKSADGGLASGVLVIVAETGLSARTNENGLFRVGLPLTECTLIARDPVGGVARLRLDAPNKREGLAPLPDLVLAAGLAMEGMVTRPDGAVAADVPVRVRGPGVDEWTTTDSTGTFVVAGLMAAEHTVTAHAHEGALGLETVVAVSRGSSVQHLRLLAETPLTVKVLRERVPVPGVHVYCSEAGALRWSYSQADDQGVVQMRGLAAAPREFEVRADQTWDTLPVVRFDEAAGELHVR